MPCPTSSRLLSCRSFVRLSAITDVKSESIEPNNASVTPDWSTNDQCSEATLNMSLTRNAGNPVGMSPIVGTETPLRIATAVPDTRATSTAGTFFVIRGKR